MVARTQMNLLETTACGFILITEVLLTKLIKYLVCINYQKLYKYYFQTHCTTKDRFISLP